MVQREGRRSLIEALAMIVLMGWQVPSLEEQKPHRGGFSLCSLSPMQLKTQQTFAK